MSNKLPRGYCVETCAYVGRDEDGSIVPDLCLYQQHEFSKLEDARRAARKMAPNDPFGEVTITPFVRDKFGIDYDTDNREVVP